MTQTKKPDAALLEALEGMKTKRKTSLDEVMAWERATERLRDRIIDEFLKDALAQGLLEVVEKTGETFEDVYHGQYTAYTLKLRAPNGTSIYVRPLGHAPDGVKPRVGVWTAEGSCTLWWQGDDNWTIEPSGSMEPDEAKAVPLTRDVFLRKMIEVLGA